MLKANPFPAEGYANGSQGRMIGIVHDGNYVLPEGSPGEMIMIPPPRFIIMEVHHKGKEKKKSIFPCERQETVLEYKRDGKDCEYNCYSNMVVLNFAFTIHGCQGQTLPRVILLLGRLPGMYVGKITWSLLYVALSRTKKLSHIKFFPTGTSEYYHSMYFTHLLKLSMPANLKKWYRSYVDHCWDRNVLRNEHLQTVRNVEKRLKRLGEDETKRLRWIEMQSLVKQLGFKTTTKDNKLALFCMLKEHMVKRLVWKTSKDFKFLERKGDRGRKRKAHEVVSENSRKFKSSSHPLKRLRGNADSKEYDGQSRRSTTNRSSRKQRSDFAAENSNLGNDPTDFVSQEPLTMALKGLENLGNSCYFNSVLQCLYHCPKFRRAIETVAPEALRVAVVYQVQMLFEKMAVVGPFPYITPIECLTAAVNIPECKRAGMIVNGPQQDVAEFLGHLLQHFHKKIRSLSDIFEGQFVSTQTCQHCNHSYPTNQPFKLYTLQMDVPPTFEVQKFDIYKLMEHFHRETILDGYPCRQCHTPNSTLKKITIIALPRILVMHLSRFRGLQKIEKHVSFPAQASIKYNIDGNVYNTQYRLMGIVVHVGSSIAGGHYISYVRAGKNWFKTNDDTVSSVLWRTVRRKKAYMLFYEQA